MSREYRPRVAVSTLGCKVNLFESEVISQRLRQEDWDVVAFDQVADLYVVNTCSVTAQADRQARQLVRRAIQRNPAARVVVTGCYAQLDPAACARIPGVDLVLGNDRKLELDRLLPDLADGRLPRVLVGDLDPALGVPQTLVDGVGDHTRAFVQVQQGCDQACTFCVIHVARGPSRSFPPTLVRRQVERLSRNGFHEIVLCGVDLGSYGADLDGDRFDLAALIDELDAVPGEFRIRLSSIDPAHLDERLLARFAAHPRLCPHAHLSLQSGNTLILKRMKRRYSAEHARETVLRLREACPGIVLGADIMVGFPTETERQFEDTLELVRELDITHPHVFCFSPRPGTPAARIPRQVPVAERKARAAQLREEAGRLRAGLLARRVGQRGQVLVEGGGDPPPGHLRGRAADYLPVWLSRDAAATNGWIEVQYRSVRGDGLIAAPLSEG